jgi:hypothetical protein
VKRSLPSPLTLFLLTLVVVTAGIGLRFGLHLRRKYVAIETAERLGAYCKITPVGPDWFRRLAGSECIKAFDEVTRLDCNDEALSDTDLEKLSALTSLEELDLSQTSITDAGLSQLKSLQNLTTLVLCNTRVSDKGLLFLRKNSRLRTLDVMGTTVTESGAADLERVAADLMVWTDEREATWRAKAIERGLISPEHASAGK